MNINTITTDDLRHMEGKDGLILQGCGMLGMELKDVAEICIEGMKEHAAELQLTGNGQALS